MSHHHRSRRPATSAAFDRIERPNARAAGRRDGLGKEALYSTAPTAAPAAQVTVTCRGCRVHLGLSLRQAAKLVAPPFVYDPFRRRLWTRCPACSARTWLEVRTGPGLRVLVDRRAGVRR